MRLPISMTQKMQFSLCGKMLSDRDAVTKWHPPSMFCIMLDALKRHYVQTESPRSPKCGPGHWMMARAPIMTCDNQTDVLNIQCFPVSTLMRESIHDSEKEQREN